ncbi:hypothetical protein M438DRAFT_153893 [Aureobasidium pullulans EXF-150]|uniref:Uncharacterized protein n=1 Tax=Aureobasidium pullulans EXF-150 TaxID=1043002 RepID=A0A074X0V9_AURPU|nr:uncharacterized protein M438DRAFT_153893 [Aureobasidium pullulans EXF-150]KEQ79043.1 hypothetical protein M438DRAFT_153893 [Aureobasidium pullulans EXF-150]
MPKPVRGESVFRPYHFRYIPGRQLYVPSPRPKPCARLHLHPDALRHVLARQLVTLSSPDAWISQASPCSSAVRPITSFKSSPDFSLETHPALSEAADCRKSKGHIGRNSNIIVTVPMSYSMSSIIRFDRLAISLS